MGQIRSGIRLTPHASASSASTATQGLPAPWAIPFTALSPMRTPVKEPGPTTAAYSSISEISVEHLFSASSTMGIRLTEWVSLFTAAPSYRIRPSSSTATPSFT